MPINEGYKIQLKNKWIEVLVSSEIKHALPLFTRSLNIVCGYKPVAVLPYNHLIWPDSKKNLVEIAFAVYTVISKV